MATELITLTTQTADVKSLPLVTDIQYLEPFTSTSLNRKFCGVVRPGVFRGFGCQPAGGMSLSIVHNKNQTGESVRFGVALVERDDYLLTVRQQHEMIVDLEAGKTSYVVLEAFYEHGVETTQVSDDSTIEAASIKVLSESQVQDHHIILCVATIPQGVTILTTAHLSFDLRPIGGYDLEGHLLDVNPHKQYVRNNADSTVNANLTLTDKFKLNLGSADDLSLYHNGADSYVDNHTGAMYMRQLATGGSVFWQAKNAAGTLVTAMEIVGGATPSTKLYAGGDAKLVTESAGISVVGKVQTTGEIYENSQRVFSPNNRNVSDAVDSTSATIYASLKGVNTAFNRAVEGEKNAKEYADSLYSKLLGDAPQEALDTLTELAEMLNDGESAISAINNSLATKADKSVKVSVTGALTGGGTLGSDFSIGIKTATTSQAGVVQLSNSVSSTSTAYAATAYALKQTHDLAASKLDADAQAVDSVLFGGLQPVQFLRSDIDTTKTSGNLIFNKGTRAIFGSASESALFRTSYSTVLSVNKGDLILYSNGNATDKSPNKVSIKTRNYNQAMLETINAVADGTDVYAELLFGGVRKLVTDKDGVSISGSINASDEITENGIRVFSPNNPPKWYQVGGNKLWISDTFITAQGNKWVQAASDTTGFLPSAEGAKGAGVSHIGSSGWWFKDAYIDTVNAKQLQSDTVTAAGNISAGSFIFAANSANTVKAIMGASVTEGEAIFGVTNSDQNTARTYIRISNDVLRYQGSGFVHDIFHEGNLPASLRKTASIADGDSVLDWAKSVASSEMAYASSGTGATDKPSSQTSDYLWVGHGGAHGTLTAWTSAGETYTNRLANGSWGGWKLQLTPGVIGTLKKGTSDNFLTASGGAYWIQAASNAAGFIPYADNQSHLGTETMRFADANIIEVNSKRINVTGAAPEIKLSGDANVDSYIRLLEADELHGFYLHYAGSSGQNVSNIGIRESGVDYVAMTITRDKSPMVNFPTNPRCTGPQVDVPTALTNKGYVDKQNALKVNKSGDTISGPIALTYDGNSLQFRLKTTDMTSDAWMSWVDSDNTRQGYIGIGSIINNDLELKSDVGNITLDCADGNEVRIASPVSSTEQGSSGESLVRRDFLEKMIASSVKEALFPVGHMLISLNKANPSTYGYPGTWELEADDISLVSTTSEADVGLVSGTNNPTVPVPEHSHDADFSGDELPTHEHGTDTPSNTALNSRGGRSTGGATGSSGSQIANTKPVSAGTPTGTVTVKKAGTSGATINVRGRHKKVYVFTRTK